MDKSSLEYWVKASKAGDQSAWNYIFKYVHPHLLNMALHICGNTPEAKDAVQDALLIAYLKLTQLKDPSTFLPWIKKICIHSCYRSHKINRHFTKNIPIASISDSWWENEFEKKLNVCTQQTQIFDVLAKLPEDLRSTMLLRYYTDCQSYEEISKILSIPIGTVRSRLNQAKYKMYEYWTIEDHINERPLLLGEEWNGFYKEYFGNLHHSQQARNTFINHLTKDLKIIAGGKINFGRMNVEQEIADDLSYGTTFGALNVVSSENITVLEARNINSVEFPDRCPETTVFVLSRLGQTVSQIHLYNSLK